MTIVWYLSWFFTFKWLMILWWFLTFNFLAFLNYYMNLLFIVTNIRFLSWFLLLHDWCCYWMLIYLFIYFCCKSYHDCICFPMDQPMNRYLKGWECVAFGDRGPLIKSDLIWYCPYNSLFRINYISLLGFCLSWQNIGGLMCCKVRRLGGNGRITYN